MEKEFNKLELEIMSRLVEMINKSGEEKKFLMEYIRSEQGTEWNVAIYSLTRSNFEKKEIEEGRIYFQDGKIKRTKNNGNKIFNDKIIDYILYGEYPEEIKAPESKLRVSYKKNEKSFYDESNTANLVG